jgi:hypothetical protein
MRSFHRTLLLALAFVLCGAWLGVYDAGADPVIPPLPPQASARPPTKPANLPNPWTNRQLFPLKAVLVVGPIDGDYGPWTESEKAKMERAARELEAYGVEVHRFYTPDTDWARIRRAAQGAHFFLYRGHGALWNTHPEPTVGGIVLADRAITPDEIRQGLALAPNAIVMLYGCYTAGTMSVGEGDISSTLAIRRVGQYSAPFFDLGVAGYYANWFGDAFETFIRYLFQGATLGQAYESFHGFDATTVERYFHPNSDLLVLWLDKDHRQNQWLYNNAFVGKPDQSLQDLFGAATIQSAQIYVTFLPFTVTSTR